MTHLFFSTILHDKMKYSIAKGVFDILPFDPDPKGFWRSSHLWQSIEEKARSISMLYGFKEIRTPIFESAELFHRTIGDATDIVSKEMYTFRDKADRQLALRPEGTAGVMRAFIEKALFQNQKRHKLFYLMPMFRYERQQLGRYRQHHQFGVEALGIASPLQDAEVMALLFYFLKDLGLKNLELQVHSLGTPESREEYKKALKESLRPFLDDLSLDSQQRFHTNCLRILDSKDPKDKLLLKKIPHLQEFLKNEEKEHFLELLSLLDLLGVPYSINPLLVRGLDYYDHTVFEVTTSDLGAQNALGGGGRYDRLVHELGGPDTPAIGFGAGLERIIQTMIVQAVPLAEPCHPLVYLIPLGEEAKKSALHLAIQMREQKIFAEIAMEEKKLKAHLRFADQLQAKYVVVLGEEEIQTGRINLKSMQNQQEKNIAISELIAEVKSDFSHA